MPIRIIATIRRKGYPVNSYTSITHFEWIEDGTGNAGTWTKENMYYWLRNGGHAYVEDSNGKKIPLIAQKKIFGIRYIAEKNSGGKSSVLLNLSTSKEVPEGNAITV